MKYELINPSDKIYYDAPDAAHSAIAAASSAPVVEVELNNLVDKMYEALCFYSHAAFEHGNRYLNGFDVDGECLEKARQAIAEYKIYKNGVI